MDALLASYGSDSDTDEMPPSAACSGFPAANRISHGSATRLPPPQPLPPPPLELLGDSPSEDLEYSQAKRIRSFPHVEGNYALHVYIPVVIPLAARKMLLPVLKRITSLVPGLHAVDVDIPLDDMCKEDQKLEQVVLGRELHISLGRTVPIRIHQIDSIVAMLKQKFNCQKSYWIEFTKWEVFLNDDQTRSFILLEITGEGLPQICKQIQIVDNVYRLHGLPEYYKDPRPHISLAWALGDNRDVLSQAIDGLAKNQAYRIGWDRPIFTCKFNGIDCRVGKKCYKICRIPDQ